MILNILCRYRMGITMVSLECRMVPLECRKAQAITVDNTDGNRKILFQAHSIATPGGPRNREELAIIDPGLM